MRPLYHPPIQDVTVEGILHALSDPVRMDMFVALTRISDVMNCSTLMNSCGATLPKSTLSQHFKILREAGLIRSERKGVELQNHSRMAELKKTFGPMISAILKAYEKKI